MCLNFPSAHWERWTSPLPSGPPPPEKSYFSISDFSSILTQSCAYQCRELVSWTLPFSPIWDRQLLFFSKCLMGHRSKRWWSASPAAGTAWIHSCPPLPCVDPCCELLVKLLWDNSIVFNLAKDCSDFEWGLSWKHADTHSLGLSFLFFDILFFSHCRKVWMDWVL